jgi:hypothetical protein
MALSAPRNTPERNGEIIALPVATSVKIYEGGLVVVDAGYAKPGAEATGLIAAGRAEEFVDNSTGQDGDATVKVKRGCFKFANDTTDPVDQSHVLSDCYIVDDETVSSSHATNTRSVAGKVIAVEADGVWVEIL